MTGGSGEDGEMTVGEGFNTPAVGTRIALPTVGLALQIG